MNLPTPTDGPGTGTRTWSCCLFPKLYSCGCGVGTFSLVSARASSKPFSSFPNESTISAFSFAISSFSDVLFFLLPEASSFFIAGFAATVLPGGKLLLLVLSSQFFDGYELESVVAFVCQMRRKFASGSLVVPVVDDNVVLLILFFDQTE